MSTETTTEELRGLRYRIIDALGEAILLAETPVLTGAMADAVLDVLRADPSAVIAALGGTKLTPGRMSQRGNAEYWVPNDLPVWVLGEQP